MALTNLERERINDSVLHIQSAMGNLGHVPPDKIPEIEEVQECLESADKTLRATLRQEQSSK